MKKRTADAKKPRCRTGSETDVQKLASACEQTGLIPAALQDAAQAEAYEALWPLPAQKSTEDN